AGVGVILQRAKVSRLAPPVAAGVCFKPAREIIRRQLAHILFLLAKNDLQSAAGVEFVKRSAVPPNARQIGSRERREIVRINVAARAPAWSGPLIAPGALGIEP